MQPQVVDPASRGMCRLPNRCRDLMGFGWPSPYSTYVVPPSLLTRTTGRSKVQKPPASRPAAAPGVATPWFRAPSPARRAASIAACGFYATRHTQCRAGGAAVSCAAGSVCRRGWMSGRPGKKEMDACMHATRLLDPTTPCLVSAASVVSLRFGRLPPPARRVRGGGAPAERLGDDIRDQTIRDRFRFQSCAVLAAYIPHGLQDRHQEASKQLQTTSKY